MIWCPGDRGVVEDLSFWIVGHWLGEGMTSDGNLVFGGAATRRFTELESLIGKSSLSLPDRSYISSNSLLELRLLHTELRSDCVSDDAGDAGTFSTGR